MCAFDTVEAGESFPGRPAGPLPYLADRPLVLMVAAPTGTSSLAVGVLTASCAATMLGTTVRIEADFEWTEPAFEGCDDDCHWIVATCVTPSLPAAVYTLAMGTRTATVDVGYTGPAGSCIGYPGLR